MKRIYLFSVLIIISVGIARSQLNTDRVLIIGRNALYYEDYILSIQYFNQVIVAKPYLAEPYFYRAVAKYYLEDYKGAEQDCDLTLDRNPYITRAYQLRGEARQRQGLNKEALEDYEKVLKNNPRDLFSGLNSSLVYLELKDNEKAEARANEVVINSPNSPQAYMVRGAVLITTGDTIAALADYNKVIELDKYYSRAYATRGMIRYMQQAYDSALVDIDHAIALDPNIYDFYINRGLIRYESKDFRGAMSDYDHVLQKDPENMIARFNRGLLRIQVGDNNNAIEDFDAVLRHEPNNYLALYNRAVLKNEIGDYTGAIADMDKIIQKYPDNISVYYARGQFYANNKDEHHAKLDYNRASQLEEIALKNVDAHVDKSYKVNYQQEKEDDIDKFQNLIMAGSNTPQESKYKNERRGAVQDKNLNIDLEPMFVLSYYSKLDNYKNSIYYSKDLDKLNSQVFMPMILRLTNNETALNTAQIKQHFGSIDQLSSQISQNPKQSNLYFLRAMDYILVQDYKNATLDLQTLLTLDNSNIFALFNLAVVKSKELELANFNIEEQETKVVKMNQHNNVQFASSTKPVDNNQNKVVDNSKETNKLSYDKIIRLYDQIIELEPQFAYAYYNRGLIRYQQGDYRSAIDDFDKAVHINNKLYEGYFNRAISYFQIKNNEKGLEDMRTAGEGGVIEAYPIIKRMTE